MGMGARGRKHMERRCCSVRGAVATAAALLVGSCSVGVPDPAVTGASAAGSRNPAAPR